jgi:hypothetical protein
VRRCSALELDQPDGIVREAASIPFLRSGAATLHLDAIVTRPANPGRYPMVVITHGTKGHRITHALGVLR